MWLFTMAQSKKMCQMDVTWCNPFWFVFFWATLYNISKYVNGKKKKVKAAFKDIAEVKTRFNWINKIH